MMDISTPSTEYDLVTAITYDIFALANPASRNPNFLEYRTNEIILSTTLLDAKLYPAEALADLYFRRWQIEVDFRHLKTTMQLDVCRGKSLNVVEKVFWAHVVAYNLLRSVMWMQAIRGTGKRLA